MEHARRLVLFAALLPAGCVIPYAYPKLDTVPGLDAVDCTAFRVDTTAHQADIEEAGEYTLTQIPQPGITGSISPQTRLTCERGFYVFGVAVNFNVGRFHDTRVRLYRPGYRLVELRAGDSRREVRWEPAADWSEEEKAIDELLTRPMLTSAGRFSRRTPGELAELPRVTAAPESTRAFVLAAAEYERVAALAPTPADAARLRDKAKRLVEVRPAANPGR